MNVSPTRNGQHRRANQPLHVNNHIAAYMSGLMAMLCEMHQMKAASTTMHHAHDKGMTAERIEP